MKKTLLLASVLLFLCAGCVNTQFVTAVDAAWDVIGPEYTEYVRNDPKLDADSKITRQRTAQLLTETIAEAQK